MVVDKSSKGGKQRKQKIPDFIQNESVKRDKIKKTMRL